MTPLFLPHSSGHPFTLISLLLILDAQVNGALSPEPIQSASPTVPILVSTT